jgi:membrane associated rhomboid family serine protease
VELPPQPPAPTVEVCYRHPNEQTRVHCTRCGRPICPECMIPAPVGFHCPECVADARREFRRGRGVTTRSDVATRTLVAAIVVMFVVELVAGARLSPFPGIRRLIDLGAMVPVLVADGQYWRLFTAIFLHANLIHIGFNAYVLWLVGSSVESTFGHARMVAIFFVTGFLASAASYAFGPLAAVSVGASGAIAGIFGAFVAYNYRRRHQRLARAQLQWATTMILLNAFLAVAFPGIDWRAHLGGLIAGLVSGAIVDRRPPAQQPVALQIAGIAALVAIGVALVVWRTAEIRELAGFGF